MLYIVELGYRKYALQFKYFGIRTFLSAHDLLSKFEQETIYEVVKTGCAELHLFLWGALTIKLLGSDVSQGYQNQSNYKCPIHFPIPPHAHELFHVHEEKESLGDPQSRIYWTATICGQRGEEEEENSGMNSKIISKDSCSVLWDEPWAAGHAHPSQRAARAQTGRAGPQRAGQASQRTRLPRGLEN